MTDFRARGTIMGPAGLTAVFGMGTGGAPPVSSPETAGPAAKPGPAGVESCVVGGRSRVAVGGAWGSWQAVKSASAIVRTRAVTAPMRAGGDRYGVDEMRGREAPSPARPRGLVGGG